MDNRDHAAMSMSRSHIRKPNQTPWWDGGYYWQPGVKVKSQTDDVDTGMVRLEQPYWPDMETDFRIITDKHGRRIAVPLYMTKEAQDKLIRDLKQYGESRMNYEWKYDTLIPSYLTPEQKMALPFIAKP